MNAPPKSIFILCAIVIFGFVLRFSYLNEAPPSLNWDEVSHGYNAYSILKTGKDEWGDILPSIFRAYGDYKLPVYIYAALPAVALFGLNEFSVRLPSTIAGTLTVLFTYLLTYTLFRRNSISILSALFVAIEPWSFFLSRVAFEANFALFLIVSGMWCILSGLRRGWRVVVGILLLGFSVWTYNSARIFVPFLVVTIVIFYRNELFAYFRQRRISLWLSLLLIALFFLPMFWQLLSPAGQARYRWASILDEGAIQRINQARNASVLPEPFPTLIHNKATYFVGEFTKNYIAHFSPSYLFFQGGAQYHFSLPGKGLIYPTELPFIIIGLLWLITYRSRASLFIFLWLLLSPVASSLTREAPHAVRSIVMQPLPQILAAIGLIWGWEWIRKNLQFTIYNLQFLPIVIYVIGLLFFIENYAIDYVGRYRTNYSWAWQYGYKEAVQFMKEHYNEYDQIIMTKKYGEPHEFILFYWPWDPEKYREDPNLIRFFQSNWYWVDRFDKFYFVNDWEIPRNQNEDFVLESGGNVKCLPAQAGQMSPASPSEAGRANVKCLLITSPGNYPPGWNLLKTIYFLDNKPAFEILEKV